MNAKTNLEMKQSGSKLEIERRRVRFDYAQIKTADYFADNPVTSGFYTALSVTFPAGEAEFIRSVRKFESKITDPKLRAEVDDFAAQEAHHGAQHRLLNKRLQEIGYAVDTLNELVDEKIAERRMSWSPKKRLQRTVAAEHFTATMAHHALTHADTLDDAPQVFKDLMLWHAIEEVEHKSVAFDVYQNCVGDMAGLKRHYLHFALIEFPMQYWLMTRFLLKERGLKVTWAHRWDFFKHLFAKNGMIGSCWGLYAQFLKPGFHPWQHDDSSLVGRWKDKLSVYFLESKPA